MRTLLIRLGKKLLRATICIVAFALFFLVCSWPVGNMKINDSHLVGFKDKVRIDFRKELSGMPTGRMEGKIEKIQCDSCVVPDTNDPECMWYQSSSPTPPSPLKLNLPPISSIVEGTGGEAQVLLVSFDPCSQNGQQQKCNAPVVPPHLRAFAMITEPRYQDAYQNILSAQRRGYIGVLVFDPPDTTPVHQDQCNKALQSKVEEQKIFIPALFASKCSPMSHQDHLTTSELNYWISNNLNLSFAKITVIPPPSKKLEAFNSYLGQLYFWLFPGPLLTLIWMLITKRCHQRREALHPNQPDVEQTGETVRVEQGRVSNETYRGQGNENTPLLSSQLAETRETITDQGSGGTRNWNSSTAGRGLSVSRKMSRYIIGLVWALGCFIFPLPFGISAGGLSFTRLDENDQEDFVNLSFIGRIDCDTIFTGNQEYHTCSVIGRVANGALLAWSPMQVFFFLVYSKVKCRKEWIIDNDTSKIIRCSWFKSAVLLLVLGIIIPVSVSNYEYKSGFYCNYIMMPIYNSLCTISNCLFLLILNKHTNCTVFVFYLGVCMVCAYIESSAVVIMYFLLNSLGSLDDLQTTALHTAEIYAALEFSFQTSMHIIRKLQKPDESLFSSLGEI